MMLYLLVIVLYTICLHILMSYRLNNNLSYTDAVTTGCKSRISFGDEHARAKSCRCTDDGGYTKITTLALGVDESVPALIQNLASYVQRLPVGNRPNDDTMMKHINRVVKKNSSTRSKFKEKIETLMDQEPLGSYEVFCRGLMRKHETMQEEEA